MIALRSLLVIQQAYIQNKFYHLILVMHLKLNILNKVKEVLKFNCSAVKQKINKMIGHLILVIKL